jgi:carbamoyl-phosphate synthase large subunit
VLGTNPDTIDLAEDRDRFRRMMEQMGIPMPESGMASNIEEARAIAQRIGYPVMVRPSFVLGGRAMEVVHDEEMLREYVGKAVDVAPERPILIDRFLDNAIEAEADALADGVDAFVPAVMEHIELAGIHSGDSACAIPPVTLPEKHLKTIEEYTLRIGRELKVCGVMNIQYAICQDKVYVLEANPRASRTVPLVSKVCGFSMARIATRLMLGERLQDLHLVRKKIPHVGVKEVVMPFNMFPEVDPVLGPEMRSTGEVLGLAPTFGLAYFKAQEAAQPALPLQGTVFISVTNRDKPAILEAARKFQELGFRLKATGGTCRYLQEHGVKAELSHKIHEPARPNILDEIKSKEIHLIINTPIGKASAYDDAYTRTGAIKYKNPYITTIAAASASVQGIAESRTGRSGVKSLQRYHAEIG